MFYLSGRKLGIKLCFIFLVIILNAAILKAQTATAPSGTGTVGDPYLISSLDNLYWVTQNSSAWGSYFKQTADIDASSSSGWDGGQGFTPIGNIGTAFSGSYDGNGKTINGLYINRSAEDYLGLFGIISSTSSIQNVEMTNSNIHGKNYVGGISGYCNGSIQNCYSTGTINGSSGIGGLSGYINGGTISNCYSSGSVNGSGNNTGGLAGYNDVNSTITNCYSTSTVSGGNYIGGILGTNFATVTNCYSNGSVSGSGANVGGLIAYNTGAVNNSFWDTETSGQTSSDGGTGKNTLEMKTESTFTNAGWDFTYTWTINSGINNGYPYLKIFYLLSIKPSGSGTAGDPYLISSLDNLYWVTQTISSWSSYFKQTADIDASSSSGWDGGQGFTPIGIYVKSFRGTYDGNGYTISGVYINRPSTTYIGLFGATNPSSLIKNLGLINVNVHGGSETGGLVGYLNGIISNCYSTGSIIGFNQVGGIIGSNLSGTISNSFSTCSVSGSGGNIGGLGGFMDGGTITNSYSTGSVSGVSQLGGLLGSVISGTVNNSFWDTETSGQTSSDGGTGKNTLEMKTASTFTNAGWDFTYTWTINSGTNNGYPFLIKFILPSVMPSGSGTEGDPYLISSLDNLFWVTKTISSWNSYFKQTSDIDASSSSGWDGGQGLAPIGNGSTFFSGSYDGDGHTINGLYINRTASDYIGLFGMINNSAVVKNIGVSNVNFNGHDNVGGLIGYNSGTITKCYLTGSINGVNQTGGLVGENLSGTVTDCYSTASVNSTGLNVGGLVGSNDIGTVTNSYSTGPVSGNNPVGGLVGSDGGGTVNNSFWDTETSGLSSSGGGTGKTTLEMKTESTFTNAGWDFTGIWSINSGTNDGYPYLQTVVPLPVELTSFTAEIQGNTIELQWNTATELNNYGFEIERCVKLDVRNENWVKIGFINGSGTSNATKHYSFIDSNPTNGKVEYRLKQIDNNGNFKYSNTIEVSLSVPNKFSLEQNYPNPFNPSTTIKYALPKEGLVSLKIYDITGQEIKTLINENEQPGIYNVTFNASDLASGVYFYVLKEAEFSQTRKLLLLK